jgi:hypothetical protein
MSPAKGSDSIKLVDAPQEARTTATLLASLAARLTTLQFISGPTAVGSIVAGFSALGRDVSKTAEGARLRRALEHGRASANGEAIWDALKIEAWISSVPPSPLLDHLRNDLALLLAGDLLETIELLPIPGSASGDLNAGAEPSAEFLDSVLGMWAFSRELVRGVEALAGSTMPAGDVDAVDSGANPSTRSMLR